MIDVVAALVWDKANDHFMICQRPESKARALKWEFPGGKVEPGETKEQAIKREIREELDMDIDVEETVGEVIYDYPDVSIKLTLMRCNARSSPKLKEHKAIEWITRSEIPNYCFCPADSVLIERLVW